MTAGAITGPADGANPAADPALERKRGKFREIAQSFEGMFMNMVMSSMRATLKEPAYFGGGFAEDVWTRMLDTELSSQASQRDRGYGIADTMIRRYERYVR